MHKSALQPRSVSKAFELSFSAFRFAKRPWSDLCPSAHLSSRGRNSHWCHVYTGSAALHSRSVNETSALTYFSLPKFSFVNRLYSMDKEKESQVLDLGQHSNNIQVQEHYVILIASDLALLRICLFDFFQYGVEHSISHALTKTEPLPTSPNFAATPQSLHNCLFRVSS